MLFQNQEQQRNIGLLLIRIGFSAALLLHAVPRLFANASQWQTAAKGIYMIKTGVPLKYIGLTVLLIEAVGALSLISGYWFRISTILLTLLYGLMFYGQFHSGAKFIALFYLLPLLLACLGMVLTGPGRYVVAVRFKET